MEKFVVPGSPVRSKRAIHGAKDAIPVIQSLSCNPDTTNRDNVVALGEIKGLYKECMKIFYITLNNSEEAKTISFALLKHQLAVCTNWFPINCAYTWEGEIKESSEVVLIVKTKDNMRAAIEKVISKYITYTNFIAELESINKGFSDWLHTALA